MKTHSYLRALMVVGVVTLAGCGSMDDVFDGSYEGDAVDSQSSSNVKKLTLRVSASGAAVSGSYSLTAVILNSSGAVTGSLNGSDVSLTLTPGANVNDCVYRITGTWSGSRITGNYQAINCPVRSDGTFSLRK